MRFNLGYAIGAAAAIALLAGCSGSGSVAPTANQGSLQSSSLLRHNRFSPPISMADAHTQAIAGTGNRMNLIMRQPDASTATLDVGEFGPSGSAVPVNEYKQANKKNHKPKCVIGNLLYVNGIGVDPAGNLWIPQGSLDTVTEYAPECGAIGTTLQDPNGQSSDIAFASNGITYVADIAAFSTGVGSVNIYPAGATSPTGVLTNKKMQGYAIGIAVDKSNNVFLSYRANLSGDAGGVIEWKGGAGKGRAIKNLPLGSPGTIAFDKAGNLLAVDQSTNSVNVYAPPFTGGTSRTITLQASGVGCSLSKTEKTLACADTTNGTVDLYDYASGAYQYSWSNGLNATMLPIGIAYEPADPN